MSATSIATASHSTSSIIARTLDRPASPDRAGRERSPPRGPSRRQALQAFVVLPCYAPQFISPVGIGIRRIGGRSRFFVEACPKFDSRYSTQFWPCSYQPSFFGRRTCLLPTL